MDNSHSEARSLLTSDVPFPRRYGELPAVDTVPTVNSDAAAHCDPNSEAWAFAATAQGVELEDKKSTEELGTEQRWCSFWLRRNTLLALAILFATMAASLVVLWMTEKAHNGFGIRVDPNHYLWTYGPTAVIMLIMSLWRQVDYYCKIMQPWQQLYQGPSRADDSVLLDYVSPIAVTSLTRAVRHRHYPVAISITGSFLLKMITVLSTGLLVLKTTGLERDAPVTMTTRFEGGNCVPPSVDRSGAYIELPGDVTMMPAHGSSSRAAFTFRNILNSTRQYPEGTSEEAVFQSFGMVHGRGVQSTLVDVEVFKPNISCEVADVTMRPDVPIPEGNYTLFHSKDSRINQFQLSTPSCVRGSDIDTMWLGPQACARRCDLSALRLMVARLNCSALPDPVIISSRPKFLLHPDSPWDIRYATLLANITYDDKGLIEMLPAKVQSMTAVICKTEYNMGRATAVLEQNSSIRIAEDFRPTASLNNISAAVLGDIIWGSMVGASQDAIERPEFDDFYAELLLEGLQGNRSIERLLSASDLQRATTKLWSGVATQYIRDQCVTPDERSATGRVLYEEMRLHVAPVSLWFMFTGFIFLSACAVAIILTVRQTASAQNPAYIITNAVTMGGSKRLKRLLRSSGHLRTSGLSLLLRGYEFQAVGAACIGVTSTTQHSFAVSDTVVDSKPRVWIPLAARRYMVALTMILPLVLVVGLEVLHQFSIASEGILVVSGHEERASSISGYMSALVMLTIATCFNALDFTIISLAPYNLLRSDRGGATSALKLDILGQMPPVAIFGSVRRGQLGPALSSLTGLLGPFLTIVSSGLWVTATVSNSVSVEAFPAHYWNVSWYNSSTQGDGGAALLLNDIQHGSSNYPSTISDSLVLPKLSTLRLLDLKSSDDRRVPAEARYHVEVNALQPMLLCDIVSDDEISVDVEHLRYGDDVTITATPQLPRNCWRGGLNGTNTFWNLTLLWAVSKTLPEDHVQTRAVFTDIHLGPWESWQRWRGVPLEVEWGEFQYLDQIRDNPAGCPSIGIFYGPEPNSSYVPVHDDFTVLLCSQKVARIAVQAAVFKNSTFDTAVPLVRRAVPIRYLNNGTIGIETFPYRPEGYINGLGQDRYPGGGGYGNLTAFPVTGTPVDSIFFNHLIYGPNGTNSPEKLAGKANRPELIERIQSLYSKYMALVIDAKFRAPLPDEESLKNPIHGTVSVNSSRLQINATSKTTLQIFLACMVAFGYAAYLMTDLRTTLPRKPTSIASVMSLLAGSDLCGNGRSFLPEGAENMTSEELDRHLDGLIVRLGWWSQNADGLSGSDDGDSREESKNEGLVVKSEEIRRRRFGIDIGKPEQLGFRPESTLRQKIGALRRRKAPAAQESTESQG